MKVEVTQEHITTGWKMFPETNPVAHALNETLGGKWFVFAGFVSFGGRFHSWHTADHKMIIGLYYETGEMKPFTYELGEKMHV